MDKVNRGKQFEQCVRAGFEKLPDVSVDRIHDQTTFYKGSTNICDLVVYKYPTQYYLECKSVHGNTLPFDRITPVQWRGLLVKAGIKGVRAGILCWWIDKDVTKFIDIRYLTKLRDDFGFKSLRYDFTSPVVDNICQISGRKRRVLWDYDFNELLELK